MAKKWIYDPAKRDGTGFIQIPHVVLRCKNYVALNCQAKALLIELALQYTGSNNGSLDLTQKRLKERGWPSNAVIYRARDELVAAGFIIETVKGQRPNKASWYALTWHALDHCGGKLELPAKHFQRGIYQTGPEIAANRSKRRVHKKSASAPYGVADAPIAPYEALETPSATPYEAPMQPTFERSLPRTEHCYIGLPSDAERAAVNA